MFIYINIFKFPKRTMFNVFCVYAPIPDKYFRAAAHVLK